MIALDQLSYRYPTGLRPAVGPVDLQVVAGERLLITGPSGCGKSTLLRLIAGLLQRHGRGTVGGSVRIAGRDPAPVRPAERAAMVGVVAQEPADQLVTGSIADEIAFAPESAGVEPARVEARIVEVMRLVGLELDAERDPRGLSGGQQQRVVVGAALSGGAPLLLLDEPLAQLDPQGARGLLRALDALSREGVTVVLVEHRLSACWEWCSRVLVLADGLCVADAAPHLLDRQILRQHGLWGPDYAPEAGWSQAVVGALVAELRDVRVCYGDLVALDGVSMQVRAGERIALVGANGAGKSTLLAQLAQLPGAVDVPQDPDLSLFCASVREELAYGLVERGVAPARTRERVAAVAAALSLSELLDRSPQALSRGQRLRVAVGAALACGPRLLLLDEPTSGQDLDRVERMMTELTASMGKGALVFATHDHGLATRHATRMVTMDGGTIASDECR